MSGGSNKGRSKMAENTSGQGKGIYDYGNLTENSRNQGIFGELRNLENLSMDNSVQVQNKRHPLSATREKFNLTVQKENNVIAPIDDKETKKG